MTSDGVRVNVRSSTSGENDMTDKEKIAHLEGWIKAAVEHASSPLPDSVIAYQARLEAILYGLNKSLAYDVGGDTSEIWVA